MQRQLEFWAHDDGEPSKPKRRSRKVERQQQTLRTDFRLLLEQQSTYASRKRVIVIHDGNLQDRPLISSASDAKKFFCQFWQDFPGHDQEIFVVACLNTKHRVQCVVPVTVGTLDASLVHPREVFKPAIIEGSSAVLLSHNHPSGDPTPSPEDFRVTQRLKEAGELLGIRVLDHIIYGDSTHKVVSIYEG